MAMSCPSDALEDWVCGALPASEAAATEAHVAECASCRDEVAWLEREQQWMRRRAQAARPLEAWREIEEQVGAKRRNRAWLFVPALAAGFALAVFLPRTHLAGTSAPRVTPTPVTPTETLQPISPVRTSAPAAAARPLATKGKVIKVETISADIFVDSGPHLQGMVSGAEIHFTDDGEAQLDQRQRTGELVHITVPPNAKLQLRTISGEMLLRDISAEVTVTGISGDTVATGISGSLEVSSKSGDARIEQEHGALTFLSKSGNLKWSGGCEIGCVLNVMSKSGNVDLRFKERSSFRLKLYQRSGEFSDHIGVQDGKVGNGAGQVNVQTKDGDVSLSNF
jgi:hypothetical protein